jgi:hypothetical protein
MMRHRTLRGTPWQPVGQRRPQVLEHVFGREGKERCHRLLKSTYGCRALGCRRQTG